MDTPRNIYNELIKMQFSLNIKISSKSSSFHNKSHNPGLLTLRITRVLRKLALVDLLDRRASKIRQNTVREAIQSIDSIANITEQALEDIRSSLLQGLEEEASQVITLKQRSTIEDPTRKILKIDTSKRIN